MATILTGKQSYVNYGWETTYGSASSDIDKVFGDGCTIALSEKNDIKIVNALGTRNATGTIAAGYEGTYTANWVVGNCWWLHSLLGAAPTKTGVGPYVYTFTAANGGISNDIASFSTEIFVDLDTEKKIQILGCKINSLTLTCSLGDVVKASADVTFKTLVMSSTAFSTPTYDAEVPFVSYMASLEIPNATAVADVQNFELTISNDLEPVKALGSRLLTALVPKTRKITGKFSAPFEDVTKLLDLFHGSATGPSTAEPSIATMELTISNGGATTALRSLVILLADVKFETHDTSFNVDEVMMEDISFVAQSITSAIYTNNTSAEP